MREIGRKERIPVKTSFCSFLPIVEVPKFGLANLGWVVNIVNSHVKSATCKSLCQFLIGEYIDSWHNLITWKLVGVMREARFL